MVCTNHTVLPDGGILSYSLSFANSSSLSSDCRQAVADEHKECHTSKYPPDPYRCCPGRQEKVHAKPKDLTVKREDGGDFGRVVNKAFHDVGVDYWQAHYCSAFAAPKSPSPIGERTSGAAKTGHRRYSGRQTPPFFLQRHKGSRSLKAKPYTDRLFRTTPPHAKTMRMKKPASIEYRSCLPGTRPVVLHNKARDSIGDANAEKR
ncbi:hypothetical protein KC345_g80 [Hortaea werneckii]|nr:hypothetical protein KC345_g80 [Hortaea werneckii]